MSGRSPKQAKLSSPSKSSSTNLKGPHSKKQKTSLNSSPSSSSSSPSKSSSPNHSSSDDRNDENTQNYSVPASPRRKTRQGSACHPPAPEVRAGTGDGSLPASTIDNEQLEALSEPGTVNAVHNADPCDEGKPNPSAANDTNAARPSSLDESAAAAEEDADSPSSVPPGSSLLDLLNDFQFTMVVIKAGMNIYSAPTNNPILLSLKRGAEAVEKSHREYVAGTLTKETIDERIASFHNDFGKAVFEVDPELYEYINHGESGRTDAENIRVCELVVSSLGVL